jgi:hypothetical protein
MKLLFGLAAFSISIFSSGQSFTWYPNDSTVTDLSPSLETQMKLNQINQTGDTLNLGIEVVYNDIPGSWDGMVCLYGICLGHIPVVGFTWNQSPIFGLDSGYVRLTANPMGGTEPCMLRIRVHNLEAPFESDTATWILNSSYLTAEDYLKNENSFSVFPNPANKLISINSKLEFNEIRFFDLKGKQIKTVSFTSTNKYQIDVNEFPKGTYIINTYNSGIPLLKEKIVIHE